MPHLGFVFWTTLILLGLLVGGYLLAQRMRRWARGTDEPGGAPFSLQDLRQMKASGQISELEYETMRSALIGELAPRETRSRAASARGASRPDEIEPPSH